MRTIIIGTTTLLIIGGALYLSTQYWNNDRLAFFWEDRGTEGIDVNINILVLGRVAEGQGGRWHAAPGLVDSIIVLNYNIKNNTINLISLPRDLYINLDGEKFKLNEVYERKKIDVFLDKIPEITGIVVDKYIVVDIGIIEQSIDELGGIDVVLENDIIDSVSGFKLLAGEQHINGEDAAWLMRNRYAKGGDFFREKNQHIVIKATFDKFNSLNTIQKTKFLFNIIPYVRNAETNFSVGEIIPKFNKLSKLSFKSIVLGFDKGLLKSSYVPVGTSSRAYILLPNEGEDEYGAIQEFIKGELTR